MNPVEDFFVDGNQSLRDVMDQINRLGHGVALVVSEQRLLLDTITDGDVRRAILAGIPLQSPIAAVTNRKCELGGGRPRPLAAPAGTATRELVALMQDAHVRWLPLLDDAGAVASIVSLDGLLAGPSPRIERLPLQGVIIAGGYGTRLMPLTESVPKPMLPVGGRPLLELTIERMRLSGVSRAFIATHHMSEQISTHFGTGERFGLEIRYVREEVPLGTAGALTLLPDISEPLLVINGDILTRIDFRAMLREHLERSAALTVALRQYDIQIPYGVVDCSEHRVTGLREKPSQHFLVNAGVYVLQPWVKRLVPEGVFNMTDLIELLIARGETVCGFPVVEYWLDIGRHADYEQAQRDRASGRI